MWRMPAMFVGQYAERDAESTLKLWQTLKRELYISRTYGCLYIRNRFHFLVLLI